MRQLIQVHNFTAWDLCVYKIITLLIHMSGL